MDEQIILLVEDDPDDQAITTLAFRENDFSNEFVIASDGVEALDYLFGTGTYAGRDSSILPQLVLLDLKLPKLNGLQVLERLRRDERTRLLPVVVLSSSVEEADLVRSYSLGANSYVRKPVDFGAFVDLAGVLGRYWLTVNWPPPAPHPN
jgi:two-component system response regulator